MISDFWFRARSEPESGDRGSDRRMKKKHFRFGIKELGWKTISIKNLKSGIHNALAY
jgi:hypothetical protein